MFKCPGCGAGLRFDPASKMMVCDHCGKNLDPHDSGLTYVMEAGGQEAVGPETPPEGTFQAYVYTCPNCGGTLLSTENTGATFCSYCGSNVTLEGAFSNEKKPDRIIPFGVSKEDCKAAYKKMMKRAIFAPSSMKKDSEIDKFRGIYVPYWIYDFEHHGPVVANGTTTHRMGNYLITDHYAVTQDLDGRHAGLSFDAASSFYDNLSSAIAPFNEQNSEPFITPYMSGFYADLSDVPASVYEEEAAETAKSSITGKAYDSALLKYGVSEAAYGKTVSVKENPPKSGMFPVWFLATKNDRGDRVSYAVVNGQSGKIAADLPIAFGKYILGSLLLALPIFLLLNLFFVLTPGKTLIASIVISLIGLFMLNRELNLSYVRENYLDDRGILASRRRAGKDAEEGGEQKTLNLKEILPKALLVAGIVGIFFIVNVIPYEDALVFLIIGVLAIGILIFIANAISGGAGGKKAPLKKKVLTLLKPCIGMAVGVLVFILHPVFDSWYYGAAVLSLLLMLWSVFDIVSEYNKQTMRQLPQFEKRGGDQ